MSLRVPRPDRNAKAKARTSFHPSTPLRPDDGRDCGLVPVPKSSLERAAIGGKITDHETARAMRKGSTAKCYGGDATRKLLDKQGKAKVGNMGM
ncbi:hypothetical protein ABIB57_003406 [Devosia sp. UYZn731]